MTFFVADGAILNKTEQAVYALLNTEQRYTRDDLAAKTSKTLRTIQRTIDSLKEKGLIKRVGSDRNGYWITI